MRAMAFASLATLNEVVPLSKDRSAIAGAHPVGVRQGGRRRPTMDSHPGRRPTMTREKWMGLCFACGSTCFLIGPFPGYEQLVGPQAAGITFFVGSIFFTAGGALQTWLAFPHRRSPGAGRAAWWTAVVQSAGTLFFNVSTYRAMHTTLSDPSYNTLVWRPDA